MDRADRLATTSLPRRIRDQASRPIMEWFEGKIYRCTHRTLVLSKYTVDTMANRHGIDRSRIEIVSYPNDTKRPSPDGPAKSDDDRPTILFVGRFKDVRKNKPLLLEAGNRVREELPDMRLLLIGDEPDESLRTRIEELDFEDSVEWIEYVDNDECRRTTAGPISSRIRPGKRGWRLWVWRRWPVGPRLSRHAVAGRKNTYAKGKNGHLVNGADARAFAERLTVLLGNRDARDRLGANAWELIVEKYAAYVVRIRFVRFLDDIAE